MSVVLIVVLVVASAAAAYRWVRRASSAPRDQVAAFTRARAVTSTWSSDPSTTPAPVREFLDQQQRPRQAPEHAEQG